MELNIGDQKAQQIMKGFYGDTPQNRKLGRVGAGYDSDAGVKKNDKGETSERDYSKHSALDLTRHAEDLNNQYDKAVKKNPEKTKEYSLKLIDETIHIYEEVKKKPFKRFADDKEATEIMGAGIRLGLNKDGKLVGHSYDGDKRYVTADTYIKELEEMKDRIKSPSKYTPEAIRARAGMTHQDYGHLNSPHKNDNKWK